MANFTAAFKRVTGSEAQSKKRLTWLISRHPAAFAVPTDLVFPLKQVMLEHRQYHAPRTQLYVPFPLLSAARHDDNSVTADLYVPKDRVHCYAWWLLFRKTYPDLSGVPYREQ